MPKNTVTPRSDAQRTAELEAENVKLRHQLAESNTRIERLNAELASLHRGYTELSRSRSGSARCGDDISPSIYGD